MSTDEKWPERLWSGLERAETQHLSYAQMEAYIDARLDPTEADLVRAHTDLCGQCAAELQDLVKFAAELEAKPVVDASHGWARFQGWFKVPRNLLVVAGTVALVTVIVALPHSGPPAGAPVAAPATPVRSVAAPATVAANHPVEAALPVAQGFGSESEKPPGNYRVLTPAEVHAYQQELALAPDDPAIRGAIAIKYSLFSVAEREYRKLEASGGARAEEGRRLLQELQTLRGQ